ncbi:MAG TPA: hypothetical protein VMV69_28785 [Pirellulales bacterium]|nr:hypothetical protein [Pirellulales bacterium]
MNGWTVLWILHLVGWGFCTLWILGTCWKEGMWGNALTWFNWWQAFFLSALVRGIAESVLTSAVEPKSTDDFFTVAAVATAIQWISFIAVFAGVKTWSDKLSRVKVAFHPILEGVGNLIFCLLLAGGLVFATLPMLGYIMLGKGKADLPANLEWLKSDAAGGLPWQMATLFCGYWVLLAVAVVVLSKPSGRLDQPKKIEADA